MTVLAFFIAVPLTVIALFHLSWAFGSFWPAASEESLARTAFGLRNAQAMPPRSASAFVGIALLAAACWL
ncbi:MAG: DUF3995 domain-containing protein [Rhizobiaceae bacterium]